MTRESFTHETTMSPHDDKDKHVGDIDVRITYAVNSWGAPARLHYDEHDHPAEAPEIDVIGLEMLNAPKSGREAVYIDAWDWLYDWAIEWANGQSVGRTAEGEAVQSARLGPVRHSGMCCWLGWIRSVVSAPEVRFREITTWIPRAKAAET